MTVPSPSGDPRVGADLTCAEGVWTGEPAGFTYPWLRDGGVELGDGPAHRVGPRTPDTT